VSSAAAAGGCAFDLCLLETAFGVSRSGGSVDRAKKRIQRGKTTALILNPQKKRLNSQFSL